MCPTDAVYFGFNDCLKIIGIIVMRLSENEAVEFFPDTKKIILKEASGMVS